MASPATNKKSNFQPDSDIHITYEDQLKINQFAKLNAKMEEYKEKLKFQENSFKTLEEAIEEVQMCELTDEKVLCLCGEIFVYKSPELALEHYEDTKEKTKTEIEETKQKINVLKDTMTELKAHLYGKFGSHINLEADEE